MLKWVVFAASCAVASLNFALLFTLGAMFVHLLDYYGDNRAITASVQSLFMGSGTSCGIVSGFLAKRLGIPKLTAAGSLLVSSGFIASYFANTIMVPLICVGILSGIGVSLMYVSSTIVAGNLFEGKRQKTALAFHTFSVGFGLSGYPYLLEQLVSEYGVRGTFLVIGGLLLNNFVCTFLFYVNKNRCITKIRSTKLSDASNENTSGTNVIQPPTSESSEKTTLKSKCNGRYLLVVLSTGIVVSAMNGLVVVYVDLMTWKGLSPKVSLGCLTAYNVGNTAGRLTPIFLSKVKASSNPSILLVSSALCGVVGQIVVLFFTDEGVIIMASVFMGLCVGGVISGSIVAVASFVNIEDFGVAFGLLLSVLGTLSLGSGPLYGFVRDTAQSYEIVIILTSALLVTGIILYAATGLSICCESRKQRTEVHAMKTITVTVASNH